MSGPTGIAVALGKERAPVAFVGETHLSVIGVVLDGIEVSLHVDLELLRRMERERRPGNCTASTCDGAIFLYRQAERVP